MGRAELLLDDGADRFGRRLRSLRVNDANLLSSPRPWKRHGSASTAAAAILGSWGRWAIEVETAPFGEADLGGLFEFTRRHSTYRPLVVCDAEQIGAAKRLGATAMTWKRFLLGGPKHD